MTTQTQTNSPESQFRDSLQEVIVIVKRLAPHCKTVEDMIGLCELALINDGQLDILMSMVAPVQLRK